ncbi:MAG: virulence factor MviN, partial [Acidobacteriota bacterium]|nr:virulence factor MviN [Acidobacteriota bacterium]
YAAGNTIVPMVAGTAVTAVAIPIYASLYHGIGAMGLVIASDIGIALQTTTIAFLLHRRRMVSLASLDYREMGRCLVTALAAGVLVWGAIYLLESGMAHLGALWMNKRIMHLAILLAGLAGWLAIAFKILQRTGSALPQVTLRRLGLNQ